MKTTTEYLTILRTYMTENAHKYGINCISKLKRKRTSHICECRSFQLPLHKEIKQKR